ncbi:medium-chain acyl-[acyl-carrier-protein] hydrolase [Thermoflexales bacterium]|nr:medium-chain acyl-[acyl-carrier-protein] hydrolase [Thermoflexales bacterium]
MIATNLNSWVICPKPVAQARLRLFCFPYAGGGASVFRDWPNYFPSSIEVCAVQLPGREGRWREPLFTHWEPLVQALVDSLQPYYDRPFAFFGHSLGALISFELARALARQNKPAPLHLCVAGHAAPQVPNTEPAIHQLPKPEFIKKLRALSGTPAEVLQNAELMELFLPVLRADFAVNETYTYTPGSPLECPISAFGGLQDEMSVPAELEGWRNQTRQAFTLRLLPGDHFFLHSARPLLLHSLVQDLSQSLSRLNGNRPS